MADRFLPVEHLPGDLDVVPQPGDWAPPGLAVPSLHDLRARHSDTKDDPVTAGQAVDGHGVHGQGGRGPGRQLGDCGPELDPGRKGRQVGQGGQGVRTVVLGAPHRVVPELLGSPHRSHGYVDTGGTVDAPGGRPASWIPQRVRV